MRRRARRVRGVPADRRAGRLHPHRGRRPVRGRGVGSALARFALEDVRADGTRQVLPLCPFIKGWIEQAPGVRPAGLRRTAEHRPGLIPPARSPQDSAQAGPALCTRRVAPCTVHQQIGRCAGGFRDRLVGRPKPGLESPASRPQVAVSTKQDVGDDHGVRASARSAGEERQMSDGGTFQGPTDGASSSASRCLPWSDLRRPVHLPFPHPRR